MAEWTLRRATTAYRSAGRAALPCAARLGVCYDNCLFEIDGDPSRPLHEIGRSLRSADLAGCPLEQFEPAVEMPPVDQVRKVNLLRTRVVLFGAPGNSRPIGANLVLVPAP